MQVTCKLTLTVKQAEHQVACRHDHFEAGAHSVQVVPTVYKCVTRDGRVRAMHDRNASRFLLKF
jgi:hypothetical protein